MPLLPAIVYFTALSKLIAPTVLSPPSTVIVRGMVIVPTKFALASAALGSLLDQFPFESLFQNPPLPAASAKSGAVVCASCQTQPSKEPLVSIRDPGTTTLRVH